MDYIKQAAEYFAAGCKKEQLLGLELEHFIVDKQNQRSLHYNGGVEEILKRLQPLYGGESVFSRDHIIGIDRKGSEITLEPAAQIEISIGPHKEISKIAQVYDEFVNMLSPILDDMHSKLVCAGYHPVSKVDELPLIPKERYESMEAYFKSTGTHGKNMMRGSAATQVSIDYESEYDFSKKFRVANILGPLFAFICDNTPVFEGQPYGARMARTHIWNNVDPARSGLVDGSLDRDFGFYDYAEYICSVPGIIQPHGDIKHDISMVFPDVRLKTNIEIRMADSMPIESALAYTALIKGLFYSAANLDALHHEMHDINNRAVVEAKAALIKNGADAKIYGRPASDWLDEIFRMAKDGLDEEEKEFLNYERFEPALR